MSRVPRTAFYLISEEEMKEVILLLKKCTAPEVLDLSHCRAYVRLALMSLEEVWEKDCECED